MTKQNTANFYSLKTKKIPAGRVALGQWLGLYRVGTRVGILPSMGSGDWPVWIRRLMATVATGLGQFWRFLSFDLGTGHHTKAVFILFF